MGEWTRFLEKACPFTCYTQDATTYQGARVATHVQGLWRNADFLKFWAGETISIFDSHITQLALPLVAVTVLNAPPLQMGILSAVGTVPILVLSLRVGAWVDRQHRRPLLIVTNAARALVLSIIPQLACFTRHTSRPILNNTTNPPMV